MERNASNWCDDNGEITPIAKNWLHECSKLSGEQIKAGIKNLDYRDNAQWPPTAVEFVSHCREMGAQEVCDEILDYLNKPADSDFWWQTEAAFNTYVRLHYNPANNRPLAKVVDDIKEIYKKLDFNNLQPIPAKPVALPFKEPTKIEKERGRFQAKMFFCIMRARPDLLGLEPDEKAKELFITTKSKELMVDWYQQDQPDMADFLRSHEVYV